MTVASATSRAAGLPARLRQERRSIASRLRRWFESRLPLVDTHTLTQRNVYILPTRAGIFFGAMLILMLLGSINYQLNLGYVLTFLLAGCGLVSMHMTHSTLKGLTLHLRPVQPAFAGDAAPIEIVITNPGGTRHGIGVAFHERIGVKRSHAWTDAPAQGQVSAQLSLVPAHRGWHAVPTVIAETRFPLGLFRAWTLWRPAAKLLAYPQPESPAAALPGSRATRGEAPQSKRAQGGELEGVRAWRRGDTLRQVLWKKVAKTGELISRETSSAVSAELWLDWHAARPPAGGNEARLSRLTAWVLLAERAGSVYGLALPGREFAPAQGDLHRRRILEALALWG